jgi:DNA (cytosine-5)-methyltransferase 1
MKVYYNDTDNFACAWLANLMRDGLIPPGEIDERPIEEVSADDVRGFGQRHWFAGIGGWPLALRLAGWPDDRPVDTGSCPCQSFSCAGSRKGVADERHLWPQLRRIVAECRPATIFGEQVTSRLGREWLAGVRADLEALGYAVGAADLCAAGVGAPHIRQRLYFVAYAPGERLFRKERANKTGVPPGMFGKGFESAWREYHGRRIGIEPGAFPMAHGIPADLGLGEPELRRMARSARANQAGRLKGYGNSIVPALAATFVRAFMGEERMTTGNNGRGNLFRDYDLEELEHFAEVQYGETQPNAAHASAYWLLDECLHELARKKGLASGDRLASLAEIFGFDRTRLELAATIRNMHADMESLTGMTLQEALGRKNEPEAISDGNGHVPPCSGDRLPGVGAALPPSANSDGDQDGGPAAEQAETGYEDGAADVKGLRLLSEVSPRPVEWLWDGYVAMGEVTIGEGHPGTNKSTLLYDLAARLTRGRDMPCVPARTGGPLSGGVLILVGEDSISKTVRSRLAAAGADLGRVAVLDDVAIPDDLHALRKAIHEVGARLVVIDTLNDFLNCNVLGNQQVRRALRPLRQLAEETNVAIVLLRHLVKIASGHSLLRGGGSVGITAMARSQLKLYRHPDDPNLRVLLQDKSTLGPLSPSLMFEVVPVGNDACRLEWHGPCSLTVEDLERKGKGSPTLEAAEKFLLDKLADGPKEAERLVEQARGLCSKRTLDEAKRNLGIKTVREGNGKDHKAFWSL